MFSFEFNPRNRFRQSLAVIERELAHQRMINFLDQGIDRDDQGFDEHGFDLHGFDRDGFDQFGFDRQGVRHDLPLDPFDRALFIFNLRAFDGNDPFDADGFDLHGFDRFGVDRNSRTQNGSFIPNYTPGFFKSLCR